jgi:hypothetical protein
MFPLRSRRELKALQQRDAQKAQLAADQARAQAKAAQDRAGELLRAQRRSGGRRDGYAAPGTAGGGGEGTPPRRMS